MMPRLTQAVHFPPEQDYHRTIDGRDGLACKLRHELRHRIDRRKGWLTRIVSGKHVGWKIK
jgi:hypothetical protein